MVASNAHLIYLRKPHLCGASSPIFRGRSPTKKEYMNDENMDNNPVGFRAGIESKKKRWIPCQKKKKEL
jgi:hypothetical protein